MHHRQFAVHVQNHLQPIRQGVLFKLYLRNIARLILRPQSGLHNSQREYRNQQHHSLLWRSTENLLEDDSSSAVS
jgi:hypothetical protein